MKTIKLQAVKTNLGRNLFFSSVRTAKKHCKKYGIKILEFLGEQRLPLNKLAKIKRRNYCVYAYLQY